MLPCNKRQKIVKRSEGLTILRCINKECGLHGQEVDEGICSRCPVRSFKAAKPCSTRPVRKKNKPKFSEPVVTTKEMLAISDDEVRQMVVDAGFESDDLDRVLAMEEGVLPPGYPPISMQLWTYKEALIRWHKAGRPVRTAEEVAEIESTFCRSEEHPCDYYDPKQKRCMGCGCKVTTSSIALFNKIKMATEHCPKEKW
jgi:hypothetical protein